MFLLSRFCATRAQVRSNFHTLNNGSYDVDVTYWLMLVSSAASELFDNGVSLIKP